MDVTATLMLIFGPIITILLGVNGYFLRRTFNMIDAIDKIIPTLMTKNDCVRERDICEKLRQKIINGNEKAEELECALSDAKYKVLVSRVDELFHMISNRRIGKVAGE